MTDERSVTSEVRRDESTPVPCLSKKETSCRIMAEKRRRCSRAMTRTWPPGRKGKEREGKGGKGEIGGKRSASVYAEHQMRNRETGEAVNTAVNKYIIEACLGVRGAPNAGNAEGGLGGGHDAERNQRAVQHRPIELRERPPNEDSVRHHAWGPRRRAAWAAA